MQFSFASPVRGFALVTDWPVRALSQAKAQERLPINLSGHPFLGPSGGNNADVCDARESKDGTPIERAAEYENGEKAGPF
jgi:hypothetical protein